MKMHLLHEIHDFDKKIDDVDMEIADAEDHVNKGQHENIYINRLEILYDKEIDLKDRKNALLRHVDMLQSLMIESLDLSKELTCEISALK